MIKVSDLFDIQYGNSLELNRLDITDNNDKTGINFVSRTAKNNGVSAKVERVAEIVPFEKGLITVSLGGTVLETFIQPFPFYTGYHVMVLTPKKPMTLNEKLFYCQCIRANKYRYSYGRQANRTLREILIPSEIPDWVYGIELKSHNKIKEKYTNKEISINPSNWKSFLFTDIFEVKKGKRVKMPEIRDDNGKYNFVSAIDWNNGVSCKTNLEPIFPSNVITVNYDGNGVAEAFYQNEPFWALDSVNVLIPKFNLNPFLAMFIITLIRKEKYRFNYGRKWHKERMEESTIKLPVKDNGEPDWEFMENYIKTLPYSKCL